MLLHVLAPLEDWSEQGDTRGLPWWKKKVAGARAYLSRRADEIRLQGAAAKIEVVSGDNAAKAITDFARRQGADLIAIATRGRGGLARAVRGSVADAVIKPSTCSILVLNPAKAIENVLSGDSLEDAITAVYFFFFFESTSVAFVFDFQVALHTECGVRIALEVVLARREVDGNVERLTRKLEHARSQAGDRLYRDSKSGRKLTL